MTASSKLIQVTAPPPNLTNSSHEGGLPAMSSCPDKPIMMEVASISVVRRLNSRQKAAIISHGVNVEWTMAL
jgi:hypothetical protein